MWTMVFGYLSLKDIFKVQGFSVTFWSFVNPSSPKCLINFNMQFGLTTRKPIQQYPSLKSIFMEKKHRKEMEYLEKRVK